jgi:uncharacterized protein (DUF2147 family)
MNMKPILSRTALAALLVALPFSASAKAAIEGQWKNPKGSVVVKVAPCGDEAYCATVVDASDKAKASARKGGTTRLVGTRILSDLRPKGDGVYKGRAFEPKRNMRAPATLRMLSPTTLVVRGCVISGIICKEQRWTRVS